MIASRSLAGTCPCINASRSPWRWPARQLVVGLDRRGGLDLVRTFDQRTHDVGLAPGRDLVAHRRPRRLLFEFALAPTW